MLVEALSLEVSDTSSEGTLEILYSGVCSTFSLSKLPRSYSTIALNASMIGPKFFHRLSVNFECKQTYGCT